MTFSITHESDAKKNAREIERLKYRLEVSHSHIFDYLKFIWMFNSFCIVLYYFHPKKLKGEKFGANFS
jgi:hypothetical protein